MIKHTVGLQLLFTHFNPFFLKNGDEQGTKTAGVRGSAPTGACMHDNMKKQSHKKYTFPVVELKKKKIGVKALKGEQPNEERNHKHTPARSLHF